MKIVKKKRYKSHSNNVIDNSNDDSDDGDEPYRRICERETTLKDAIDTIDCSYVSKNIRYAHLPDIKNGDKNHLTGDDGGYEHYWRCNKCQSYYSFTDK